MKPHLFIFEGPDAAGKSTLARALRHYTRVNVFHCTWKPKMAQGMYDYMMNVLDNAEETLSCGEHMVIDRCWPSELVYGSLQGRAFVSDVEFAELDRRIKNLNGVYVHCSDDLVTQCQRHEEKRDPDHPYDSGLYTRVVGGYFAWYAYMRARTTMTKYQITEHGGTMSQYCHNLLSDTESTLYTPSCGDFPILPAEVATMRKMILA